MKKILGVIIAAGFAHRLLFLGKRQLWTDELMQALISRASSVRDMLEGMRAGQAVPAPLDYFIQKGFVLLLGEATWVLRLHAAVFATLSIWFFFRIARHLFGVRTALYSTFLFTFFPLHYHYSQEGRPYALFLCLTLVSYDLLFRKITGKQGRWSDWALIGLASILLLYQSYLGFLVLGSQVLGLLLTVRNARGSGTAEGAVPHGGTVADMVRARRSQVALFSLVVLIAVAAFVPWIQFSWSKPLVAQPSELLDIKLPLRIIKELGDGSYPASALILAGVAAGVLGLKRHGRKRTLTWLLAWALPSIPAVWMLAYWSGYFFSIRHVLHATPALVLIAGYGLSYVGERMTMLDRLPYQLSAPAIAYAALLCSMSVWIGAAHWKKEPVDWSGTARMLAEQARPGDAISMPKVYRLLEYFYPRLGTHRASDLDPGLGLLGQGEIRRRIVVCFDGLTPDPCEGFRGPVGQDQAWEKRTTRGFSIFLRESPAR